MTLEAKCGTCGETFLPDPLDIAPESDAEEWKKGTSYRHLVREDGTNCAGVGRVVGRWG